MREAHTAAQLRHTGIVPVYEVTELNGHPAIVSEFVHGTTLGNLARSRRLSFRESASIVLQVARALEYAHSLGVVHRDVKPGNIMVESPGDDSLSRGDASSAQSMEASSGSSGPERPSLSSYRTRILDFGLALRDEIGMTLTVDGQLIGTPAYMSPEQAVGSGHKVDRRSDIYSLGVVLYELLCGERPFLGSKSVLIEQVLREEPRAPRRIRKEIPRDLESIALKAMAKNPGDRYRNALALAEDLRRFLDGMPVVARPVGFTERTIRWVRRNPRVAALSASVATLLVVVAVVSTAGTLRIRKEHRAALDHLWNAHLSEAQARRFSGQPGQKFASLSALADAAMIRSSVELRDEAIACIPLVDLQVEKVWRARGPGADENYGVAFDAHFAHCAINGKDGLAILATADSSVIARLPALGDEGLVSMSPDGRFVLAAHDKRDGSLCLWNLPEHRKVLQMDTPMARYDDPFSADGARVVMYDQTGTVSLFELPAGRLIGRFHLGLRPSRVCMNPTGRSAVFVCGDGGSSVLLDFDSGRAREIFPAGYGSPIAWHPDGRRLALGRGNEAEVIDLLTGDRVRMVGHESVVVQGAFSPAGDLLATRSWDGTTRLWSVLTGKEHLSVEGHFVRFDATGDRLAFAHGPEVGWWRVAGGRECRTIVSRAEKGSGPWSVDCHPNGRILVSSHDDGVRLWDLAGGNEFVLLQTGSSRGAVFSADGKVLYTGGEQGIQCRSASWDEQIATLTLGPSRLLAASDGSSRAYEVSFSPNGRWAVAPRRAGRIIVVDLENPADTISVGPHEGVSGVAISPDGRTVISAAQHRPNVKVWDAPTRAMRMDVPCDVGGRGIFSPDGRWLVTAGGGEPLRLFEARSLKPVFATPNPIGILGLSDDGAVLAATDGSGTVLLLSTRDGHEFARLTSPDRHPISGLCFAPDGSWLAVSNYNLHRLQVWDLRAVRAELAEIGLDWDQPPLPEADAQATLPIHVESLALDPTPTTLNRRR